jgi:DNA repair protein RadA/Sms
MIELNIQQSNFIKTKDIEVPDNFYFRIASGITDLDKALGGGFIAGQTFTLAGTPGCGKTTMLLQMLNGIQQHGLNVGYISAEETIYQLGFTATRIGVDHVQIANMNVIESIFEEVEKNKFDVIIIDSLPAIVSKTGLRRLFLETYLANYITSTAKQLGVVVGTILHSTKRGTYKGTTLFPHNVDCNIMIRRNKFDSSICEFEVTKNRFGSAGTTYFKMTENGFDFTAIECDNVKDKAKKEEESSFEYEVELPPVTIKNY